MIKKKDLLKKLAEKDDVIQSLKKIIMDKDQVIGALLVELGECYDKEIMAEKTNLKDKA